tara:strand:+ start:33653 stop:34090 length:438 start_codon:yes stop_codon:yes gene_type:complete
MENNEIIAEFMGMKPIKACGLRGGEYRNLYNIEHLSSIQIPVGSTGINATINTRLIMASPEQLVFHSDWRWLMEVVEKIEELHDANTPIVHISKSIGGGQHYCDIDAKKYHKGTTVMVYGKTKIEAVYNACVKFIKWYSENNQKN